MDWLTLPFRGLFALVTLVTYLVILWAIIDAALRPDRSYPAADKRTKGFWLGVLIGTAVVGWLVPFIGLLVAVVAAIVYLVDVRPRLREVQRRGGSSSGPYGPW